MSDSSLVHDLEQAAHLAVSSVFREQCFLLGYSAPLLAHWETLPIQEVSKHGWQAAMFRAGLLLADAMETNTGLAYHNRTHTAETLVAARWLVSHEYGNDCLLEREEGLKLLTVMAAHDLDYEAIPLEAPLGSSEAHSAELLRKAFEIVDPHHTFLELREELAQAIVHTEPVHGTRANAQALEQSPGNLSIRLRVLANEADVLASVLEDTGVERGERLAAEWQARGHPLAGVVASAQGRKRFLESLPLASQAAGLTGLREERDRQIQSQATPSKSCM